MSLHSLTVVFSLALPAAGLLSAAPIDVLAAAQQSATPHSQWCATAPAVELEAVLAGGCRLERLDRSSVNRGFSRQTFWIRLELYNPGTEPVQRWLTVGDPRLAHVSLFQSSGRQWIRQETGHAIPLAVRAPVAREWGALPVDLAPKAVQAVWLRVHSDTPVSLETTVWEPAPFRLAKRTQMLWQTAACGTLGAGSVIALLIWLVFRQPVYGNLAMLVLSSMMAEMFRAGLLQVLLWPDDWPVPSHVNGFSHALQCFFGSRFCRNAVPGIVGHTLSFRTFRFLEWSVLVLISSSVFIPHAHAIRIATVCGCLFLLVLVYLLYRSWQGGDRMAALLFLTLSPRLALQIARFLSSNGIVPLSPLEATIGPWLMVLSTPLSLITVMEHSEALKSLLDRTRLEQARSESAAQISFLARMSHELRSPLDSILGNAQLIARSASPTVRLQVAGIMESGRVLLRLIDDTLDYARGVAGSLRVEPEAISLDRFLRKIERRGRMLAAQQQNRFVLRSRGSGNLDGIRIDSIRLQQILENLLSNAARHTRNGEILVDCTAQVQPDGSVQLEFAVADTGCGIPHNEQGRIFRPFERLGPESQYRGKGAGLGLPIARQFAELLGGELILDPTAERGACFRFSVRGKALSVGFRLPPEPLEAFDAQSYSGRRRTVLVVDDDQGSRAVCAQLLEDLGFVVHQAGSGDEAVAGLPRIPELDLILTDQFMDRGDGWMLLDAANAARPDIPVILLSAAPPSPPANRTSSSCFSGHFLKPVDHAALLQLIGELLELDWNGSAVDPHPPPQESDAVAETPPGLELLQRLVKVGHITAIESWADTLSQKHPVHARFAERVIRAARGVDVAALHSLAFHDMPPLNPADDGRGKV
jgi:signal transduction histidine kinase/CheY-like chemotaxis protein